jgi:hypothetical protein
MRVIEERAAQEFSAVTANAINPRFQAVIGGWSAIRKLEFLMITSV